jgi:phosphate/sulfate permease
MSSQVARTADPYDDTDVIDARAPRANQVFVGLMSLTAVLTGWWVLLAVVAMQLAIGLTVGRRYCLPCWFYFEVVQPRVGEGEIEDSRPPRFANIVGMVFLTAAVAAYTVGASAAGAALGLLVAALALLAASTGLCVGCELYKLLARVRGVRAGDVVAIDPGDVDPDAAVIVFTHPLCTGCRELEHELADDGRRVHVVDVSRDPALARKYRVSVVPQAFEVAPGGRVLARIA